jgi:hypothetical protein
MRSLDLLRSWVTLLFLLGFTLSSSSQTILINEVLFHQFEGSAPRSDDHDWVELFSVEAQDIDLDGWVLLNQAGDLLYTFPAVSLPPAGHLVVHFSMGDDDLDFSDGAGHLYTGDGDTYNALLSDQDALGLFDAFSPTANLIDFVAWHNTTNNYVMGPLDILAQNLGQGQGPLQCLNTTHDNWAKRKPVWVGTSIGRTALTSDTNSPLDWRNTGGPDAFEASPGAMNIQIGQLSFSPADPAPVKPWTLLLYMSADNLLERDLFNDLDELATLGSNENANIVVITDLSPDFGLTETTLDGLPSGDDVTTAFRGRLLADEEPYQAFFDYPSGSSADLGEINMGDPQTLSDFIQWGVANYPAEKYGLVLWSGGGGWKFSMLDDTDQDELHMQELTTALTNGGTEFELIVFDQPLMATVEVAWQIAPFAKVMVGSQGSISEKGLPYDLILGELNLNPAMGGEELAEAMVNTFHAFHFFGFYDDPFHTLSAIALDERLDQLAGHVSGLADALATGVDNGSQLLIREVLENTHHFEPLYGDANYIDLRDFAARISASDIPAEYKDPAADLLSSLGQAVLIERNGPQHNPAQGLSIYFPYYQTKPSGVWQDPYDEPFGSYLVSRQDGQLVRYAADPDDGTPYADPLNHPLPPAPGFLFPQDHSWDEFLHRYYEPHAHAGENLVVYTGTAITLDASASTDADGTVTAWFWDLDPSVDSDPTGDVDKDGIFNEADDDADVAGPLLNLQADFPGQYAVVLTVWDDHNDLHPDHWETDQDTIFITVVDSLQLDAVVATPVTCHGFNDGAAEVFFSGGAPPFTITWSDGQEGVLATGLEPGMYSVTVADDLGSEVSGMVTVTEPDPISFTTTFIQYPECPGDSTGIINILPQGGVGPYDIFWTSGQTGPSLLNAAPGNYVVFIIDIFGCLFEQQFELPNVDTIAPSLSASPVFLALDENGEAALSPAILNIQASDNCAIAGLNIDPPVMDCSNLGVNTVTISAIDDSENETSITVQVTIIDDEPPVLPSELLFADLGPDGTVVIDPADLAATATDNCTIIAWEAVPDTFDCGDVGENTVTVTVTDQSGNTAQAQSIVFIQDELPPVVLTQNITVQLDASGQISIAADAIDAGSSDNCGFISKQLSQTQFTCDDLADSPVEVTLTITDLHGNSATGTALVTVVDPLAPVVSCPEDIIIEFCGPVGYDGPTATDNCDFVIEQTEGLGSEAVFPFGVTTETYVVTDAGGNSVICSFTITVENDLALETEIQDVSCFGESDGNILLSVSGGTAPYAIFWSAGGNTNLPAGSYSVTIYDFFGCETIESFEIGQPDELIIEVVEVQNETNGQQNGGFTLAVSGGTPPYLFEGATFEDTLVVSDYAAGNYTIGLSDQNGCNATAEVTIENVSGLNEPEGLRQFRVFPNPAGAFTSADIQLEKTAWLQLSLIDATGRTLRNWQPLQAQAQVFQIDLTGLAPGIYAIKLAVDGETAIRKLVVE